MVALPDATCNYGDMLTTATSQADQPWEAEVRELHEFFQAYFLGETSSLDRADQALAADFMIVGPDGNESDRDTTMATLRAGHDHTTSLVITTSDHVLHQETADMVVASYVEHHQLSDRMNARRSTVVFRKLASGPNGLQWLRVHETWSASANS